MGFHLPTEIQCEAIPLALQGRDVIGLAQTVHFFESVTGLTLVGFRKDGCVRITYAASADGRTPGTVCLCPGTHAVL